MKNSKYLFFLFLAVLSVTPYLVLARAGGGGGSSGSGGNGGGISGLIAAIVFGIYSVVISAILYFKNSDASSVAAVAALESPIWDLEKMRSHAKSVFFKMQEAWMNRDIDSVQDIITDSIYEDYPRQLHIMKVNKEQNILESINVSTIKIISCEDFTDDSRDSYVAYIKGTMIDYTVSEKSGSIIKNDEKKEEGYKDTYHFIRVGDKWQLNDIDNFVSIGDLLTARNYKEQLTYSK